MRKTSAVLFGLGALTSSLAVAQENEPDILHPPRVLVIYREFLKPGREGSPHEKTESAVVQALARAKWPTHYLAADSLAGRSRTVFLSPYNSFADWVRDHQMMMKDPALSAARMADGDLVSDTTQTVLVYHLESSMHADDIDMAHMRGFRVTVYHVKLGHRSEWDELVKTMMGAYGKVPGKRWAMYEIVYGAQERYTFAAFEPFGDGADLDADEGRDKEFMSALGEEGMKKVAEKEGSAVAVSDRSVFMFNPAMSYPPDAWIKADPGFWKPIASKAMPSKEPAANPGGGD
jgi:hypothetical protein